MGSGAKNSLEQDRVKNALGIPEVVPPSGWTGHLPQRKSNTYNVGQTWTSAYGSITHRDCLQRSGSREQASMSVDKSFRSRSGTPVAGYKGFVARSSEVPPGTSHADKMIQARDIGAGTSLRAHDEADGGVVGAGGSTPCKVPLYWRSYPFVVYISNLNEHRDTATY